MKTNKETWKLEQSNYTHEYIQAVQNKKELETVIRITKEDELKGEDVEISSRILMKVKIFLNKC